MQKVFNYDKTDYERTPLLMGQTRGLLDTVNKQYPDIFDNYLTQKSLNWMFNEFDFSSCVQDFKNADRSTYDMMIKTLAWQWEADSVASSAIAPILAPFITSSELWMAWLTVTDMECVTPDHEVLTTEGWKPIAEVTKKDKVAQWEYEDKTITFVNPTGIIRKHYDGPIYELSSNYKTISQKITENHRMPLLYPYKTDMVKREYTTASKMPLHGNVAYPVGGVLPSGRGMTAREKILVAIQADGSLATEKYTGGYTGKKPYSMHLTKERKKERIRELCEEAGYELREYPTQRAGCINFNIMVPVEEYEDDAKSFDWINLEELTQEWCDDFIFELSQWDGNTTAGGNVRYLSTNKKTIEMARTIAHLCGRRTNVTTMPASVRRFPDGNLSNTRESYQLYFTERNYLPGNTVNREESHYVGEVHCLQVPSSYFLVRRNGVISVTGNCIHGALYSEIVRNSFDDPTVILDEILRVQEAHERLGRVVKTFNEAFKASHEYALGLIPNNQDTYNKVFMFIVALYCMERIQFAASFAVTFAICDTGMFQAIGKGVQKIAQDELEVHSELDRIVLQHEMKTERGQKALEMMGEEIQGLVEEVVESEFVWVDYLFSEGRELVGINKERLKDWTLYCAEEIFNVLNLDKSKYEFPEQNPLRFMDKWLNISKIQASPQEQDIAAYKMGVLQRDDEGVEFDVEF